MKQNSRIRSLLESGKTLVCLQQNQCRPLGPVCDDTNTREATCSASDFQATPGVAL